MALPNKGDLVKTLSIRDVIGPIMIGPSSSHTAGALRIALMTRQMLNARPKTVEFRLYGSFSHTYQGHGTDKALVAGMLGLAPDDERIRDSFGLAHEQGLNFRFTPLPEVEVKHPNTVEILVEDEQESHLCVRGESIGGGAAVISALNGVEVHLTGEHHSIVTEQRDVQGVLAHITARLNAANLNIASVRLFRTKKGQTAYTIIEIDEDIPSCITEEILTNPNIRSVNIIHSDKASADIGRRSEDKREIATWHGKTLPLFDEVDFADGNTLLAYCEKECIPISDAICIRERALLVRDGMRTDSTSEYLDRALEVMRASALEPIKHPRPSMGGLIGGEADKINRLWESGIGLRSELITKAAMYAMAVLETNASMGRIVAASTAGSSGVIPGVLFALKDTHDFTHDQLHRALANAAAIGYLITRNATVAGAEGGCQAEVGSASAMAASAACQLLGGSPKQCFSAASIALSGLMGLVCDPIAGLVEAPCQKRNATGAVNALVSAQIALAGCSDLVDFDQTVEAMYRVGRALPFELRESALGGLAATPAACAFCESCHR